VEARPVSEPTIITATDEIETWAVDDRTYTLTKGDTLEVPAGVTAERVIYKPTEDNPQARLVNAFHDRTQRCVGVSGHHLACAEIEQRHREGNHNLCLPVEDGASDHPEWREPNGFIDRMLAQSVPARPVLPEGEALHSSAMERYWKDAEFHARCETVFRALAIEPKIRQTVVYALALDDIVRRER
jgi:hypothetical protein